VNQRKLFEWKIITELAQDSSTKISSLVISKLRTIKNLLSGEDSGFKNTWEEICNQQNKGQSIYWGQYLATIQDLTKAEIELLKPFEQEAIWLTTHEGEEWFDEEETERLDYPVSIDDICDTIVTHQILPLAMEENRATGFTGAPTRISFLMSILDDLTYAQENLLEGIPGEAKHTLSSIKERCVRAPLLFSEDTKAISQAMTSCRKKIASTDQEREGIRELVSLRRAIQNKVCILQGEAAPYNFN
jgi:hypothetical protein